MNKITRISLNKTIVGFILLMILIGTMSLPAFGAEKEVIVQTPPVAAALPLLWMQESGKLDNYAKFKVKISSDHKRAIALISKNQIDMMVTGVNVGAKIYNKGIDVHLLNVNTWAVDYLLTYGFKADSWTDLKGKSILLPLKGGPLDFLVRYLLQENGVNPEDVNLVYRSLPSAARYFMTGKVDSILLPEPLVTVSLKKNKKIKISKDIQQEWGKLHNGDERIPFVGLFVSADFAKDNPQLTKIINGMYLQGIEWVNNNPEKAAQLGAKYFKLPAPILKGSFSRVNLDYFSQQETKKLVNIYFNEILKMYPEMLGGKVPDENFYN